MPSFKFPGALGSPPGNEEFSDKFKQANEQIQKIQQINQNLKSGQKSLKHPEFKVSASRPLAVIWMAGAEISFRLEKGKRHFNDELDDDFDHV